MRKSLIVLVLTAMFLISMAGAQTELSGVNPAVFNDPFFNLDSQNAAIMPQNFVQYEGGNLLGKLDMKQYSPNAFGPYLQDDTWFMESYDILTPSQKDFMKDKGEGIPMGVHTQKMAFVGAKSNNLDARVM